MEFLKGLRMVINNASAYPKEHPYFRKSVDIFKQKVDALFPFLNPIKIDITSKSLFIDGRYWEKERLYVDLASMFHLRKIKSIEFKEGLSLQELIDFLSSIALPIREIIKQGGIKYILDVGKTAHVNIQELDYSKLLQGEGEEVKDIWGYLFKEALEDKDLEKINKLADNFEEIMGKFKVMHLLEDEELRTDTYNFLEYLKTKEKDKFYSCTKGLLKLALRDKNISQGIPLDKLKIFFKDLNKDDLSQTLLDEILENKSFNYLSLTLFSKLFDEDAHKQIAPLLEEKIKSAESLKTDPGVRKKVKELFSTPESSSISALYRQALNELLEADVLEGSFSLDRNLVHINYYFLLINLLVAEKDKQNLSLISERLLPECNKIIEEKNLENLKLLLEALDKKIKEDAAFGSVLEKLEERVSNFIENMVFEKEILGDLKYFIDKLKKSSLGFDFYINKIFDEGRVNPYVLTLLLKFFPQNLPHIYEDLEKKHSDIDFTAKVVRSLAETDSPLSLEILKHIFYSSNNIIKIEVLRATPGLAKYEEFLLSILKSEDVFLRKEALSILAKDETNKKQALEEVLCALSPWGKKNKVIIENIMLVEELELKEAAPYLASLSKRRFFWNRNVRKKALEVLKKWHGRED